MKRTSNDGFFFLMCIVFIFWGIRALIIYIQCWTETFNTALGFFGFTAALMITSCSIGYIVLKILDWKHDLDVKRKDRGKYEKQN